MAHYAYLDENNIVTMVIVGKNEDEAPGDWETYYGAKRTSYNTRGGVYYDPNTNEPGPDQSKAFRKNYAGIGYTYDLTRDAFIPPQPYPSWVLDESSCLWEAPVPYPTDGKRYSWDEATQNWIEITE
jgi:hypothetical protein